MAESNQQFNSLPEENIMADEKKCGYSQCLCTVSGDEHYCSDYCKDAQSEKEIEIQCDCKHDPCAL